MNEYALYLESGPRRRKTMVHVLDLLGCVVRGATTEQALDVTPAGIQRYLRFLKRHGEAVDPKAAFTTAVAEHIMEGPWLGNGNPAPGFGPDFQSLDGHELDIFLLRMDWMLVDLIALLGDIPLEDQLVEQESAGRSISRIIEHIAESQYAYLRVILGKQDELPAVLRGLREDPGSWHTALKNLWAMMRVCLEEMTEDERTGTVQRGQVTWTARRALRRLLEHPWEHMLEIAERIVKPII
jgi:uncharacterized damage-inducible protein DinB/predicted RNase H-like HicB family nuclease